jgi:hypothetical protein
MAIATLAQDIQHNAKPDGQECQVLNGMASQIPQQVGKGCPADAQPGQSYFKQ